MILPCNFSLRTATLKALKKLKQRIGSSDRSKSHRRKLVRRQILEQLETRDLMANIVAVNPEDGAINWALTTDLTITFDVPVAKGQGNIHVVRQDTGVLGEAIDVNSSAVTISGSTVTVDIPNDLLVGTAYHVLIDNGAFVEPSSQQTADAVLLTQNFDLLPLSPFATVSGGDGTDFTLVPPLGFTVDNSAMASGGVPEYKGWSFMDKQPWINQAGDQSRSSFSLGSGTVAVGDPDQFDDVANGGPFNSTMLSRPISLVGVAPGTAKLEFDSSFRPEDTQVGVLQVRYDGGAWEDLLTLNPSNTNNEPPSASNINANINERLISGVNTGVSSGGKGNIPFRALQNPAGASSMQLRWNVTGKNTWWWAVDNLRVTGTLTGIPFTGVSSPTFWNLDIPKLTVSIDRPSMSEAGGTAVGTVTRNGLPNGDLIVTLASNDTTEATVPPTVTIPNGQLSATFPITAVDDTIADREQVVSFTGNAPTFSPGSGSMTVLDDEGPKVTLLTPADNSTGADYKTNLVINLDAPVRKGNGLVHVVRASDNLAVASIDINSTLVTVSNTATTSMITIDPPINLEGLTDYYILMDYGALVDTSSTPTVGTILSQQNFDLLPLVPFTSTSGGDGTDIAAQPPVGYGLSGIAAGGNADFDSWSFVAKDSWINSGNSGRSSFTAGSNVIAVADAGKWYQGSGQMDTFLTTAPIDLSVVAAGTVSLEFDATFDAGLPRLGTIQVSYNGGASWVDLAQFDGADVTSSRIVINSSGASGPGVTSLGSLNNPTSGSLVFRFGMQFAAGGWFGIDNLSIFGNITGLPFAGFTSSTQWNFKTAEAPTLTVTVAPPTLGENGGISVGTVSRNLSTTGNLVVNLSSSDTTEATVPATVTIPDGQSSVTFNITGVNDTIVDGSQAVVITATAVDYFNVPATVTVLDDDFPRIVSVSPADNSTAVPVDSNLVITFDQNVKKGNGFVHIIRVADGKAIASIDIRSSAVTVVGAVVTVNPPTNLAGQSDYFIAFDGGSVVSTATTVAPAVTLFSEDFELLTLGPAVFETVGLTPNGQDFTTTPPASFVVDNSQMPPGGVPEWTGWTFPAKSFWATQGGQSRANFALGTNTIAVADTDEWDDTATLNNNFNGIMRTNPIDLSGIQSNSVSIEFDSSFRPENSQIGKLDVSFDGGTNWTNLLTLDPTNTSNATNAANINQRLTIPVSNPTSGSMVFRLGVTGANDWWWAIDNVKVIGNLDNAPTDGIARNAATTWNFTTAEAKTLTVTASPTAIAENGGTATATVTRNLGTTGPVTVTLVSSDTSLATVPASVVIPDGQASATFNITAVDDNFADGLKLVNITASSTDFVNGVSTLSITDNETPNVIISEIMYNPAGAEPRTEWMELYNRGTETVDLSSWKFDDEDNTNWTAIPAGTLLPVGKSAVIYNSFFNTLSETQFRTDWAVPSDAIVVGVLWGDLNNSPGTGNEVIRLRDAGGTDQRVVNYDDDGTVWPAPANGPSIYLKDVTNDNTVGANWARSVTGTDFARNPTSTIFNAADVGSPGRVPLNTLAVNNVVPSSSAVAVKLNRAFDPLKLNLVDSNNVNGAADVTLVGSTVGAVKGSVILDADNKGFTFIKTGGPLEADTYTLTLRSAANGFTDASGNLLDGDGNNVAGGDFVQQLTVTAPASGAITLRVGDFVRGYGQAVNLPANSTSGLPITISTGVNVTGASFTVNYNPALLTITGGATSIAGATVTVNTSVAGQAVVNVTSSAQFSAAAGLLTLVNLTAVIPDTAPNGSKGVISLSGVTLTSADASPLVSTTDDGYLIASYKGDVNNNRAINTGDVTGLLRSVSGALSTTGFPSLKLADPVLVGDMNDSTTLTSGDVTGLLRFISGANGGFPAIPALPSGITPPPPGADPQVFVPQNLVATPGSTVVVPININVTEPTGASVAGIDVSFTYDTSRFTFASVATGSALSGFTFSSSNNTATAGFARLVFATDFGPAFANGFVGTLLNVTLNVLPGAASGASAINLTAVGLSDNDTNDLLISPPVTPGVDSSDGIITIPGAGNSAPSDIGLSAATIAENAGANATVGTLSTTDANAGDSFTYTLVNGTGSEDNAAFNISGSTLRATASLDFEAKSSYNVRVRSTDGGGLFFEKAFVITVTNVNESPVFSPSSYSFSIAENSAASTAVGTVTATDPDASTTLTYSLSGTGASNFVINSSTGAITVAAGATLNFEGTNTWNLTATASDGTLSTTAPVVISLTNVNESPVFSPTSYSFSIAENSAASTAVGTVTATDPDASTTLTYSLSGTGASNFVINASTGAITVAAGATLNFEDTNTWNLTATASDGTLSTTAPVVISLTNVNESPVFSPSSYSFSIAENSAASTAVGTVTATDPDASTTLTYSLEGVGASNFVINPTTGAITVAAGAVLNFEGTTTFVLNASVSDGSLSSTAAVTIEVTNVNEAPVFAPANYNFSLPENSASGTAVGTVTATDPDASTTLTYSLSGTGANNFVINASTGAITVAAGATLNFEGTNTWNLTATVSDGSLTATAPVVISLTNVNESPVFGPSSYNFSIAENSAASTAVGTVTATDPDASTTLTYSLSGTGANNFVINASTGAITVAAGATLNFEGTNTWNLTATVSDGSLSATAPVVISLTNVNESPVFSPSSYSFSIAENSAASTAVGTVTATDPDASTTLTYSLSGTGANNFVINASTGAITVAAGASFNAATTPSYSLTATASDGSLSTNASVTVSVTAAAPSLVSVSVNGGDTFKNAAQRSEITSLVIGFSAPVVVSAGAFSIANVGLVTSQTPVEIAQSQILVTADASQMVYTIRFAPGAGVVTRSATNGIGRGHSLADGNYVLTIDPTKVTRGGVNLSASNTLGDGDNQYGDVVTDDFFRMFGDGNGDGVVSTGDTAAFRASLSAYDAAFDADGDGFVLNSGVDRTDFLSNYGKRRRR